MVVEDGIVKMINIESDSSGISNTAAEEVLKQL